MKQLFFVFFFSSLLITAFYGETLFSPDNNFQLDIDTNQNTFSPKVLYTIRYKDEMIINPSQATLSVSQKHRIRKPEVTIERIKEVNNEITLPYGEQSSYIENYNSLLVKLKDKKSNELQIEFRAYNEGIAFRYIRPASQNNEITVKKDLTQFNIPDNSDCFITKTAQGDYNQIKAPKAGKGCERPLVFITPKGTHGAILEAAVDQFPSMVLDSLGQGNGFSCRLKSDGILNRQTQMTPWRVIMAAQKAGELLENSYLLKLLSPPSELTDVSWIKPGKVLREVSLTTTGAKAAIDFAQKNGLQYIEFDAGWYGYEYTDSSDATTVTLDPRRSNGPLEMQKVVQYGKQRGIGIIVYVNRRALETQLDEILPLYRSWGIAGLKFGFVTNGDQKWNSWLHNAVRQAGEFGFVVDIHDTYRPTGMSRTLPNLLTQEGIRGDEEFPSPHQTLITIFTRMLAGAGDNTACYYDARIKSRGNWTKSFQLAKTVAIYSPLHFIYWYDRPYEQQADAGHQFWKEMPTTWDETRVLSGEIGKSCLIARRQGKRWFVAMMSGEEDTLLRFTPTTLFPDAQTIHIDQFQSLLTTTTALSDRITDTEIEIDKVTDRVMKTEMERQAGDVISIRLKKGDGVTLIMEQIQ